MLNALRNCKIFWFTKNLEKRNLRNAKLFWLNGLWRSTWCSVHMVWMTSSSILTPRTYSSHRAFSTQYLDTNLNQMESLKTLRSLNYFSSLLTCCEWPDWTRSCRRARGCRGTCWCRRSSSSSSSGPPGSTGRWWPPWIILYPVSEWTFLAENLSFTGSGLLTLPALWCWTRREFTPLWGDYYHFKGLQH